MSDTATPRKVACQISLSVGFSRQVYWSGLPFPPPEDLSHPGIEPGSPAASAFQGDSLSPSHRRGLGKFLFSPCKGECCVALVVKNLPANARRHKRLGFNSCVGEILWRRNWQPTPVFSLVKSHRRRSLAGYRPWGRQESGTAGQLSVHVVFMNIEYP